MDRAVRANDCSERPKGLFKTRLSVTETPFQWTKQRLFVVLFLSIFVCFCLSLSISVYLRLSLSVSLLFISFSNSFLSDLSSLCAFCTSWNCSCFILYASTLAPRRDQIRGSQNSGKQGRIHGYPSCMRVGRSSAGEGH